MTPTDDDKRKATKLAQELWAKWIDYEADNGQDWEPLAVPILAEALSSARAQGAAEAMRWRAVSETPPIRNYYIVAVQEYDDDTWRAFWDGEKWTDCSFTVTHWCEFPEPPTPPEKE